MARQKTQWFNPRTDKPKHRQSVLLLMLTPPLEKPEREDETMYMPSTYFAGDTVKGFAYDNKQLFVDERYIILWTPVDFPEDEGLVKKALEQAKAETKNLE